MCSRRAVYARALTAERLRSLLHYDPLSGQFTWRVNTKGAAAGDIAGKMRKDGYLRVSIDGAGQLLHRLAVLYQTGAWPPEEVDHIDGVRVNNAWSNLRCVSRSVNMQNKRKHQPSNETTGVLGTSFHRRSGKFSAQIKVDGKKRHLGLFTTVDAAFNAYVTAKRQTHAGCTI